MDFRIEDYDINGFAVIPQSISAERRSQVHEAALACLEKPENPYELESTLGYPGAPSPESEAGKIGIRRLKGVYQRHDLFRQWAHDPVLLDYICRLLGSDQVSLTRSHHNCLMTKLPKWSSDTGWHQDIRYWAFESPHLVTAWLSITEETQANGCMQVIPGSHKKWLERNQFDEQTFFREDMPENQRMIDRSISVESNPGDLLLFDARLLHSAQRNRTQATKLSLAFTYKLTSNKAICNTRSSLLEEIDMNQNLEAKGYFPSALQG